MIDILQKAPEIWDLFTLKEEYNSALQDQFGRFPYYASQNRNIFEPVVSNYLVNQGFRLSYPDNKPFAVCLTHDIDTVYTSILSKGLSTIRNLKKGNFRQAFNSILQMRSKKLPLCNFSAIMDLEEKYDAKSTFFFMAENPGERDYTYNITDFEPEIRTINNRGWEVGLHGGHTSYLDSGEMIRKKKRLEQITRKPVIGYRNHYLRFKVPQTWEYLSQAGFMYDSTLGYADCAGFRNGMCHPFRPYNLEKKRGIEIIEIPLIVMDCTLDETYMRLDEPSKWEFVKSLIDRVAACHGVFTVLWHNTYMTEKNFQFYEKLLKYCHEKNAWLTTGREISSVSHYEER